MPVECEHVRRRGLRARHASRPVPDLRRQRRGAPGAPVAARPDRDRRSVPEVRREPVRSIPTPVRRRAAATAGSNGKRSIEVEVPRGIDDGQRLRLAGRGPAAPRGGPAGDLYVGGARRAPPAISNAAATTSGTGCRSRSCRPRSARSSRSTTLDGPREVDVAVGHAARRAASGCAGSACRRCARRGAAISSSRSASTCRRTSRDEEAELLAQFAELRGEKVSSAHEGLLRAHPVRVPAVNARAGARAGRRRTQRRTCSSTRSTTGRDRRRRRPSSATGPAARAGRARDRGRRRRRVAPLRDRPAVATGRLALEARGDAADRARAAHRRRRSRSRSRRAALDDVVAAVHRARCRARRRRSAPRGRSCGGTSAAAAARGRPACAPSRARRRCRAAGRASRSSTTSPISQALVGPARTRRRRPRRGRGRRSCRPAGRPGHGWTVVVGPEGGLAPGELAALEPRRGFGLGSARARGPRRRRSRRSRCCVAEAARLGRE